jgi:hypothetical protein
MYKMQHTVAEDITRNGKFWVLAVMKQKYLNRLDTSRRRLTSN